MNRTEYLAKLDALNLDKDRYCIVAGGVMLLYGLREDTSDIDLQVDPDYFEELKSRFDVRKSPKFNYLYELNDEVEAAVLPLNPADIRHVDGYPVISLEWQLNWMRENNRPKDQERMKIIERYLAEHQ